MNATLAKVSAAIVAIPLCAIMLAGPIGGGLVSYDYGDYERDPRAREEAGSAVGTQVSKAEAYSTLGNYNPCIFVACEGE